MIDVRIESPTGSVDTGKLDNLTGVVYLKRDDLIMVDSVHSLRAMQFLLTIKEMPKEQEMLDFSNLT